MKTETTVFTIRDGAELVKKKKLELNGTCGTPKSLVTLTLRRILGGTNGIIDHDAADAVINTTRVDYDRLVTCLPALSYTTTIALTIEYIRESENDFTVVGISFTPCASPMVFIATTVAEMRDLSVKTLREVSALRKTVSDGFSRILQECAKETALSPARRSNRRTRQSPRIKPLVVQKHGERRR